MATDKKKIQETEGSGFGAYDTGRGGGTPVDGGGRGAWHKAGEPGHRDEDQPRDASGRFTYNSVNGKGLAPSSDGSRGKTINPLLLGDKGKDLVYIKDVEKQFGEKSGSYWDKYKGSWYKAGGEFVTGSGKTVVAAKPIWQVARGSYDSVKGEFQGESEAFSTKKGRTGKEEAAAKQKVEATGQEQAVTKADTGEIKVKPGTPVSMPTKIKEKAPKQAPTQESPVVPSTPIAPEDKPTTQTLAPTAPTKSVENNKPFASGKYTIGEANAVKEYLKQQLGDEFDEDMWDDNTIEEFIDSNGGKQIFASSEPKQEQDSKTVKKIKEMGFDENDKK